jgi:hypothetical protein
MGARKLSTRPNLNPNALAAVPPRTWRAADAMWHVLRASHSVSSPSAEHLFGHARVTLRMPRCISGRCSGLLLPARPRCMPAAAVLPPAAPGRRRPASRLADPRTHSRPTPSRGWLADPGPGQHQTQPDRGLRVAALLLCSKPYTSPLAFAAPLWQAVAKRFNLPLTSYEAGPSIVEPSVLFGGSPTPGAADKYIALQRDPGFEAVYSAYLSMFDSIGMVNTSAPYMHFSSVVTPTKYGSWGLLEYTGQSPSTAPK